MRHSDRVLEPLHPGDGNSRQQTVTGQCDKRSRVLNSAGLEVIARSGVEDTESLLRAGCGWRIVVASIVTVSLAETRWNNTTAAAGSTAGTGVRLVLGSVDATGKRLETVGESVV